MSFSAAVQWWEDWQLRLLVLASLFFQYFLFAAAVVRKLRIPHWCRALIWLAYQCGDVVAIYALATLFNRHKEEALAMATNSATAHLQTLWAPILLLHLGGQDGITAYSIEDNENWRRHLLVSVSQITVAIYVFRKSWWSGDKILLRAAILLFVPGILKCLEKPWALSKATVTSITNSYDSQMELTLDDEDDGVHNKDICSLEEYVQAAAESVAKLGPQPVVLFEDEVADQPYHLFVDLGHPYSIRLRNLRLVAPRSARADVHGLVRSSLSKAFDRLYTKHRASSGGLLRAAVTLVTFVVIGLFHRNHRGVYDRADVVVTYVLLCCAAALELVSACLVLGSGLPRPDDRLPQYNLVGYLARGEKHPRFLALARLLGARLQLDRLWCTEPPKPSLDITGLVYDHVAGGWKDYIPNFLYKYDDATSGGERRPAPTDGVRAYRQFNDSRGHRTLERQGCVGRSAIEESLRMPFDESVLLWHLATELCYFDHVDTGNVAIGHSRTVSNYMAYLLFVKPEMLIPGARSKLFRAAYHELRKMLKPEDEEAVELVEPTKKAPLPRAKDEMVRKVIQKVKSTIGLSSEDLVHRAWAVAHDLMEFAEEKKWEFVRENRRSMEEEAKRKLADLVKLCMKKVEEPIGDGEDRNQSEAEGNRFAELKKFENADEFTNEDLKKVVMEKILMELMELAEEKAEKFVNRAKSMAKEGNLPEEKKKKVEKKRKKAEEEKKKLTELVEFAKDKQAEFFDEEKMRAEDEKKLPELMTRKRLIDVNEELLMNKAKEYADDKMWVVIRGVWVEMLCFSAGRCRGYLHAKSLGNGGEYLSYVWLLLYYMGMETMPERMQRPELQPAVGDTGALVLKTPTDEERNEEPARGRRRRGRRTSVAPTPPARSRTPGAESIAGTAQDIV